MESMCIHKYNAAWQIKQKKNNILKQIIFDTHAKKPFCKVTCYILTTNHY